ncbi:MAG: class I SAM-dependent methyltransferase [Vicinamibacterales bacterium]
MIDMPTIEENKKYWDGDYAWEGGGAEWSADWGSVSMQWYGTILPRVHRFLPAGTILEIGCGYGRWTDFLKEACGRLIAVDLSEECIGACRRRFAAYPHLSFHCNDGTSLGMAADGTVDFVFSFDALALADAKTMEAYLAQLSRLLTSDGAAFLHHSNLGAYRSIYRGIRRIPMLEGLLQRIGVLDRDLYWRDFGVSADLVADLAAKHGLTCASQELIRWGTKRVLLDALSVVTRQTGAAAGCRRLRNTFFDREAANLSRLAALYASDPPRGRAGPARGGRRL